MASMLFFRRRGFSSRGRLCRVERSSRSAALRRLFALLVFSGIPAALFLPQFTSAAITGPVSEVEPNHWAWSDITGWIDFWPAANDPPDSVFSTGGVWVGATELTGWAQVERFKPSDGWVSLNCSNTPVLKPCSAVNYKVVQDAAGILSGWAWSDEFGWISFNCNSPPVNTCATANYSVSINQITRQWSGWAWADAAGWISVNCGNDHDPAVAGVQAKCAAQGGADYKVALLPPPYITQRSFIFENDDGGNVDTNSAQAPSPSFNISRTTPAALEAKIGERLIVRFQIDNASGAATKTAAYKLQFCDAASCTYTDVVSGARIQPGLGLSNDSGAAVTTPLAGSKADSTPSNLTDCLASVSHVFDTTTAKWHEDTATTVSFDLGGVATSECTELAFVAHTRNAIVGKTYNLRLAYSDGTPLEAYAVGATPQLKIVSFINNILRYSKDIDNAIATADRTYFLDLKGYGDVNADDGTSDAMPSGPSAEVSTPSILFAKKNINNSDAIDVTWKGTASTASDVTLQVYRFATATWDTIPITGIASSCDAGACTLRGYLVNANSNYYDAGFWTYWRVWLSGTGKLSTNFINIQFEPTFPPEILLIENDDTGLPPPPPNTVRERNPALLNGNPENRASRLTIRGRDLGNNGTVKLFGVTMPLLTGDTTCDAGGVAYTRTCIRVIAPETIADTDYFAANNLVVDPDPAGAPVATHAPGIRILPRIISIVSSGGVKVGGTCNGCPQGQLGDSFTIDGNHLCESPPNNTATECPLPAFWSSSITDPDRVEFQLDAPDAAPVIAVPDVHHTVTATVPGARPSTNPVWLVSNNFPSNRVDFWILNGPPDLLSTDYEADFPTTDCADNEPIQPRRTGAMGGLKTGIFCAFWTDPNGPTEKATFWACRTPDFNFTPGSLGCVNGEWMNSGPPFSTGSPLTARCDFSPGAACGLLAPNPGWYNAYVFLCDWGNLCDTTPVTLPFLVDDRPDIPGGAVVQQVPPVPATYFSGVDYEFRVSPAATDLDAPPAFATECGTPNQIRYWFDCESPPVSRFKDALGNVMSFASDVTGVPTEENRTWFAKSGEEDVRGICRWSGPGSYTIEAVAEDRCGVLSSQIAVSPLINVLGSPQDAPQAPTLVAPLEQCIGTLANQTAYEATVFEGCEYVVMKSIGTFKDIKRAVQTCYGFNCPPAPTCP